ncbi:MAG: C39 family peptidase [Cellulosilyticaceae bacterium]
MKKYLFQFLAWVGLLLTVICLNLSSPLELPDDLIPAGNISSPSSVSTTYVSQLTSKPLFTSQYNTGNYSTNNCAPTSLYMILRWLGQSPPPIAELRMQLTKGSGWVYTNEIEDYLSTNHISYQSLYLNDVTTLKTALDQGILLLCMDISQITPEEKLTPPNDLPPLLRPLEVGKESTSGTGHFIVATGYLVQGTTTYIETLDPLNSGVRYYKIDELFQATSSWYPYVYLFTTPQ